MVGTAQCTVLYILVGILFLFLLGLTNVFECIPLRILIWFSCSFSCSLFFIFQLPIICFCIEIVTDRLCCCSCHWWWWCCCCCQQSKTCSYDTLYSMIKYAVQSNTSTSSNNKTNKNRGSNSIYERERESERALRQGIPYHSITHRHIEQPRATCTYVQYVCEILQ